MYETVHKFLNISDNSKKNIFIIPIAGIYSKEISESCQSTPWARGGTPCFPCFTQSTWPLENCTLYYTNYWWRRRDKRKISTFAAFIYIPYKRGLSVCLFVRIWSPNYWMDLNQIWHGPPPGICGYPRNTFFWVVPPRGGIILEKLKKHNFPHVWPRTERDPFAASFAASFEHIFFLKIWILF